EGGEGWKVYVAESSGSDGCSRRGFDCHLGSAPPSIRIREDDYCRRTAEPLAGGGAAVGGGSVCSQSRNIQHDDRRPGSCCGGITPRGNAQFSCSSGRTTRGSGSD